MSPLRSPLPGSAAGPLCDLADLAGLRSAPCLDREQRLQFRRQLERAVAGCEWFTIGVMAPSAALAEAALQRCETALGWARLERRNAGSGGSCSDAGASGNPGQENESGGSGTVYGPVFLKGNQRTGTYSLRPELGLGEGILITGHNPADPAAEATWGPLPLDLFEGGDAVADA